MSGSPYSDKELMLLKAHYPRKGAKGAVRILRNNGFNRSIYSVRKRARKIAEFGDVAGYVKLADVHPDPNNAQAHDMAKRHAKQDGVLLKVKSGKFAILLVPEEWADQYSSMIAERLRTDAECRHWLSSGDVADLLGVKRGTVSTYVTRPQQGPVSDALQKMERRKGMRYWYWEPRSVRQAIREFRMKEVGLM